MSRDTKTRIGATGLSTFYSFWCYVTPLLGGFIADQYLGKYKTILTFASVYLCGLLILVCTSIPSSLHHGAGLGGFIVSILLTGLGTGGIKANVAPLIAEQYTRRTMAIGVTKKGERVVIDPYVTIQRIFMIFYWYVTGREAPNHLTLFQVYQYRRSIPPRNTIHGT